MTPIPTSPLFSKLAVIGPGLIGSSILRRAFQDRSIARTLVTSDHNPHVLTRAKELGFADDVVPLPEDAVKHADCVILCVPVGAMGKLAGTIIPHMKKGAILSDVGSTKVSVIKEILPHLTPDISFIPAHPLAGTEYSGPDAGFSTLFENRWCLITPPDESDFVLGKEYPSALEKIEILWQMMGARTRLFAPAHHDKVCAIVSHLPHLLAFTICGTADDLADETRSDVLDFAASGFRDFTRIASSDPIMWRDVFLNNKEALLEMLARFMEDAQAMARAIRWGDENFIIDRIERGRRIRKSLIDNKQA